MRNFSVSSVILAVAMGVTACLLLSACATGARYVEPPQNGENAIIKLDNPTVSQSMLNPLIFKPLNGISFVSIDDKTPGFFASDNMVRVTPGPHKIDLGCTLNGAIFGYRSFAIDAKPGGLYTIAYPKALNMHGYTIDVAACNKLTITPSLAIFGS